MTDIDPAAVRSDQQALKDAFTYRSLQRDIDLVFKDLERPLFAEANAAGRALYPVASEFVLECYYERGALEPLVHAYARQPYRTAARYDRLLNALESAQRFDLIEHLWTSIARLTRAEFFYQRPCRDTGDHARVEEFKNHALEAYAQGIDWMTRLGRLQAAELLIKDRNVLREERFPALPPPSDLRRIDEPVFWDLIAMARSGASTTVEELATLGKSLLAFKGAEIKRFCSFYAKLMKQLCHWNVWALAYAARGGCSDEAFAEFRAWLILQGDPALCALCVTDPGQAAARVPAEPDLPDGPGLAIIEEAYLMRTGSSLAMPPIDPDKPKGKEWTEAAFAATYPQLIRHYASRTEL